MSDQGVPPLSDFPLDDPAVFPESPLPSGIAEEFNALQAQGNESLITVDEQRRNVSLDYARNIPSATIDDYLNNAIKVENYLRNGPEDTNALDEQ